MDNKTYLLTLLLDCGSLDINKLNKIIDTCEDFDEDLLYDTIEDMKSSGVEINCNSLISDLLWNLQSILINRINEDLGTELDEDDFEIYVNCLDSHITYTGESEEAEQWLKDNCDLVEF